MALWKVTTGDRTARVEAANAIGAVGAALASLGLTAGALGRLVCSVDEDGSMDVIDPGSGVRLRVEAAEAAAPSALAGVFGEARSDDWIDAWLTQGGAWDVGSADAGSLSDARRMEVVFERGSEIAEARDLARAAEIALQIAKDLIPAEAGAVLAQTRGARRLRFVAATGPQAERVLGQVLPADKGIAGFVYGFGMGVVVADVHGDARHYAGMDKQTGYRTKAVLAVPVRSAGGATVGCLEVLNPQRAFTPGDLNVAEAIASALSAWVGEGGI